MAQPAASGTDAAREHGDAEADDAMDGADGGEGDPDQNNVNHRNYYQYGRQSAHGCVASMVALAGAWARAGPVVAPRYAFSPHAQYIYCCPTHPHPRLSRY